MKALKTLVRSSDRDYVIRFNCILLSQKGLTMTYRLIIFSLFLGVSLTRCSQDNDFKGQSAATKASGTAGDTDANGVDPNEDGNLSRNVVPGNESIIDQTSGSVNVTTGQADCNDANRRIEDSNATFVFNYNEDIRAFLNTKCNAQIPTAYYNAGGTRGDSATQLKICQLKGYESVGSSTTWGYSSPGDNHVTWWDGSKFVTASASLHNNITGNLVCKGLIKSACHNSNQTVTCN